MCMECVHLAVSAMVAAPFGWYYWKKKWHKCSTQTPKEVNSETTPTSQMETSHEA